MVFVLTCIVKQKSFSIPANALCFKGFSKKYQINDTNITAGCALGNGADTTLY